MARISPVSLMPVLAMNQSEVNIMNAEVLFRAVHHRSLVLARLAAVDCVTLSPPSFVHSAG